MIHRLLDDFRDTLTNVIYETPPFVYKSPGGGGEDGI